MTRISVINDEAAGLHAIAHGDFVYRDDDFAPIASARDAVLVTTDGRRLLDVEAANGGAILGYRPELLQSAVQDSAGLPGLPSFCESTSRLEVARQLCELIQQNTGLRGRIAFEVGGAQGIELAIKIARHNGFTGQMVCFEGGYHGRSAMTAQLSSSARYRSWLPGDSLPVARLPLPDCFRCRFGLEQSSCNARCAQFATSSLTEDFAGRDATRSPCAVLEPLLNVAGMAVPDERYMLAVVQAVRAAGGIVIADEIFTGFWRTGKLFGFQHFDFVPDLIVLSKSLTNGMAPLSAVWARTPLLEPDNFPPGSHSATFVNLPLSMSLASAALHRFGNLAEMQRACVSTEQAMSAMLNRLSLRHCRSRAAFSVRSWNARGACGRLMLSHAVASQLRREVRRTPDPLGDFEGLIVSSTGMMPDVINLHPPLCMTTPEWASAERMLDTAMTQIAVKVEARSHDLLDETTAATVLPYG